MGQSKSQTLSLLPLGDNAVLLPGTTLRLPLAGRSDVPALLTSLYTRARSPRPDASSIPIGCVPLSSPLLSPTGRNLIQDVERDGQVQEEPGIVDPSDASKRDLFAYGTVAKISGVQGRRTNEIALLLEGGRRFKIERITQERPYFKAQVTYLDDESQLAQVLAYQCTNQPLSDRRSRLRYPRTFRPIEAAFP